MKPSEIRAKDVKECSKILDEKKEELFGLRLKLATSQLAKTSDLRNTKRDIARLLTIIKERDRKVEVKDAAKRSKKG